jgi:acyl-CoA thioester hydrolase
MSSTKLSDEHQDNHSKNFLGWGYNLYMSEFRFYHPVEVRYGDLDPQGHLNNAKYLTYIEQARIAYIQHLGLWKGGSFLDVGIILAEARLTFKAPVLWGQPIQVGVRINRLGNKSFDVLYTIEDSHTHREHASGSTVQVAYDYHSAQTTPIPEKWRETIKFFENL